MDKIKADKIAPTPRWHFLFKNYAVWGSGALALIIGGLACSVIAYLIRHNDWNIYGRLTGSFWEFVILTLPYFWLLFLAAFIGIIYYNIRHTKKGYRYPLPLLVAGTIAASVLLGGLFFRVGLGQAIDDVLGRRAPFYENVINRQFQFWVHPESGRLIGRILEILPDNQAILADPSGQEWRVIFNGAPLPPNMILRPDQPIRVFGEIIGENEFRIREILPLPRPGRRYWDRDFERPHRPAPRWLPESAE